MDRPSPIAQVSLPYWQSLNLVGSGTYKNRFFP